MKYSNNFRKLVRYLPLVFLMCIAQLAAAQSLWKLPAAVAPSNYFVSPNLISTHFVSASQGWAVGANGTILTTTNGGTTWQTQTSGTTNALVEIHFVNATKGWAVGDNGTILTTTNGGTTWQEQTSGTTNALRGIHFINATKGWAVGENGTILTTSNGGVTWAAQTSGTTNTITSIHFTDENNGVFVTLLGKVYATTDGGANYTKTYDGVVGLTDVFFINQTTGWAVGAAGLRLATTNGGLSWSVQVAATAGSPELRSVSFTSSTQGWTVGGNGTILTTTNGGTTWQAQTSGITSILFGVSFVSATQGWAVGGNGTILTTSNGGVTWSSQPQAIPSSLNGVSFPTNTQGWVVGNTGAILATTDGGVNWQSQTSGTTNALRSVNFVNANQGWVVGASGTILATSNGGTTWQAQTSGTTNALNSVHFTNATQGWAVGAAGTIIATTNGGSSWAAQTSGVPAANALNSVHFINATNGWAVGGLAARTTVSNIVRTTDGGATWQAQTAGVNRVLRGVFFISATQGWAVGDIGTILTTTDGGATWQAQTSGTTSDLRSVYFTSATQGWVAGSGGTIFTTTNGGASWQAQASGTINSLTSIHFSNAAQGRVVGDGGIVLLYENFPSSTNPAVTQGTIATCYPTAAAAEAAAIAATTATADASCPGTVTKTASTSGTCSAVVTVTATDACGTSSAVTYNTRIDAPTATQGTIASTYTTVAAAEAAALAATTASDNCPGALTETVSTVGTSSAVITVTTTDACGNAAQTTYNTSINIQPTLSAITNQTVCDGQSISNIAITLGGDTGATLTASSSNAAITPTFTFGGSGANRTLTIATTAGQVGTTTVTVTATATGGTTTSTFTLTINATPAAPTASAQNFVGTATVANLVATGSMGSTIQWYAASTGGTALASTTALATGMYYVSQTINGCESTRTAVSVTVVNPITLSAITNQATCDGETISNIAITLGGNTDGVTLTASSSNTAFTPTFTFGGTGTARTLTIATVVGQAGSTTITVTATNASGGTATQTFTLALGQLVAGPATLGSETVVIPTTNNLSSFDFGLDNNLYVTIGNSPGAPFVQGSIAQFSLTGASPNYSYITGLTSPGRLNIGRDGKLYFINNGSQNITRYNGQTFEATKTSAAQSVISFRTNRANELLFLNFGASGGIFKLPANFTDASTPTQVFATNANPISMVIDPTGDVLYYLDSSGLDNSKLIRANVNGTGSPTRVLATPRLRGLAFDENGQLWISHGSEGKLSLVNVSTGTFSTALSSGFFFIPVFKNGEIYYRASSGSSAGIFKRSFTPTVTYQPCPVVGPPTITATAPATRCGPGDVTLSATPSAGSIRWYTTQTGGSPLTDGTAYTLSGNSITLKNLTTTTTLYAEAVSGSLVSTARSAVLATVTSSEPTLPAINPLNSAGNTNTAGNINYVCPQGGFVLSMNLAGITFNQATANDIRWYRESGATPGFQVSEDVNLNLSGASVNIPSSQAPQVGGQTRTYYAVLSAGCNPTPNVSSIAITAFTSASSAATGIALNGTNYTGGTLCPGTYTLATTGAALGDNPLTQVLFATEGVIFNVTSPITLSSGTNRFIYTRVVDACNGNNFNFPQLPAPGIAINVGTSPAAPTASAQSFCGAATVANLVATGSNIQWYSAATGGTALASTTALATGTYYASQTVNGCESARTSVSITVNSVTSAPTATATQPFCGTATVANLVATGTAIQWYAAETGGTALAATTALATGTYYVSQTTNNCESSRVAVSVTINPIPTAPTASAQSFCGAATVANLVATGTAIQWYSEATGGTALAPTTALATGTYYASQTVNGCESTRTPVSIIVNTTPLTLTLGTVTPPTTCTGTNGSIAFTTNFADGTHALSFQKDGAAAQTVNVSVSSGSFVLANLAAGTYTNLSVTFNACTTSVAGPVVLSSPTVSGGALSGSSSVVAGINSATLTLTGHTGSIVKWQSSSDASFATVEDIAVTTPTYTASNLTATGFYRVVVEGLGCPPVFSSSASISVTANQAPVARCQTVVREVNAACQVFVSAQEFDGGSSDPDGHALTRSINFTGPYAVGSYSVEFRVTDINGASSTCTALLTVADQIPPTVITRSVDLLLDDAGRASLSVEQVNAGSFDNCSIQSLTLSKTAFTCADLGTQDVLLTAVDFSGNRTSQRAVIRVLDNRAPRAVANNTVVYLKANGTAELDVFAFSRGSSDNCSIAKIEVNVGLLDCSFIGQRPVEVKLIDPAGNFSKATAMMTVLDTIAPVVSVKDTVLYLDAAGKVSLAADKVAARISEACGINSVSVSRSNFDCSTSSEMVRFTAVDRQGNQGFAMFRVTVRDTLSPVLRVRPATVYLDRTGVGRLNVPMIDAGSSDNCGITSLTLRDTLYSCNEVGERKTLLTARDAAGNTSRIEVSISVRDSLAPMIQARDSIQVFLNAQGTASLNVEAIELGSTDNCGIASRVLATTSFSCSQVGVVRVGYKVTDVNGNSSEKVIVVTVSDTIAPVLQTQNARLTIGEDGRAVLATTDVITSATDNCAIGTQTLSSTTFGCGQIGNREVTVTVTDVNGNKTEANVLVEIVDGNGVCPCSYSILAAESVTLVNNRLAYGGVGTYGVNKLVRLENTRVNKETVFIRSTQIEADETSRPNRLIERQAPQPFAFEQMTTSASGTMRAKRNQEMSSSEGQFGVIRVRRGATLTLTSDKVVAEKIIIRKGGALNFSQKTTVGVIGQFKTESDVVINGSNEAVRMYVGKDLVIGQNNSINGYFHTLQEAELKRNRGTDTTRVSGTIVGNTVVAMGQVVWEGGVIRCGEDDTDSTEARNPKAEFVAAQENDDALDELVEAQLLEEGESKLYMYGPNPTSTHVTLRFYQVPSVKPVVQILQNSTRQMDGMVKQTWLSDQMLKLDLSELAAGMYLVTVRVDGKVQTVKIVKE